MLDLAALRLGSASCQFGRSGRFAVLVSDFSGASPPAPFTINNTQIVALPLFASGLGFVIWAAWRSKQRAATLVT